MNDYLLQLSPIEALLDKYYDFRRNPVLDRTEYRLKDSGKYSLLTERDFNSILRVVRKQYPTYSISNLRAIVNSDFIKEADPFIEYFERLPYWEPNDPDYITELAQTISTSHQDFWLKYFKKWLVASVACVLDEEHVNHQVLVLVGAQGLGKSTWLNALLPKALTGYLYSGIVNPNNKDTLVHLAENFFINLDELENLNKTELGSLKALITQSAVKLRKAYGMFNENLRRRASFMGSVNEAEFLTDTTGNRRYLCFTCERIDYKKNIDMNKVYAQAYALYKSNNFIFWFEAEDIFELERLNSEYIRTSLEEELLLKYFRPTNSGDKEKLEFTPFEIIDRINELEKIKFLEKSNKGNDYLRLDHLASSKRLGQALQKHNFKKVSQKNRKPYLLREINDNKTVHLNYSIVNYEVFSVDDKSFPFVVNLLLDFKEIKGDILELLSKNGIEEGLFTLGSVCFNSSKNNAPYVRLPEIEYIVPMNPSEWTQELTTTLIDKVRKRLLYFNGTTPIKNIYDKQGNLVSLLRAYKKGRIIDEKKVWTSKSNLLLEMCFDDAYNNRLLFSAFGQMIKGIFHVKANDVCLLSKEFGTVVDVSQRTLKLLATSVFSSVDYLVISYSELIDLQVNALTKGLEVKMSWIKYEPLKTILA